MNLYFVMEYKTESGAHIFATNRNQARWMFCQFYGKDYCKVGAYLEGKTDKVNEPEVVWDEKHPLYPIVKEMGEYYTDPETGEEL